VTVTYVGVACRTNNCETLTVTAAILNSVICRAPMPALKYSRQTLKWLSFETLKKCVTCFGTREEGLEKLEFCQSESNVQWQRGLKVDRSRWSDCCCKKNWPIDRL